MIEFSKNASLLIYMSVFLLSAFLFSSYRRGKGYRLFAIISSSLLPAVLSGIRYSVGTDYFSYVSIFRMIRNTSVISFSFKQWIEPGFRLLVKMLSLVGGDNFCFGSIAFITILIFELAIIEFYGKYNENEEQTSGRLKGNYELALLIYLLCFFPVSFNATRHVLAASIAFYAVQFAYSNRVRCGVLLFMACTIHVAAIIAIPLAFLPENANKKINTKLLTGMYIAFAIAVIFRGPILSLVTRLLHRFSSYGEATLSNRDFWIKLLVVCLITLYIRSICGNYMLHINYHAYVLAVILCILGFRMAYVKRVAFIYELSLCLVAPTIPSFYFDYRNTIIVKSFIVIGSIAYFILLFYVSGSHGIFPYAIKF